MYIMRFSKKQKKSSKKRRIKTVKKRKTYKKGGFMSNVGVGFNGIGINKESGHKVYDWKSGKWLNQDCYNFMGFKHCTQPHE